MQKLMQVKAIKLILLIIYLMVLSLILKRNCNNILLAEECKNIEDVKLDLNKFLIYFNFNRIPRSLRKEVKVGTPSDAVQSWFKTEPKIFKILHILIIFQQ